MKSFLERYGFVALFIGVILFVILMISPLGKPVRGWFKERWYDFQQTELYIAFTKKEELEIVQDLENVGYFDVSIESEPEDVWTVTYRFKDSSGFWSDWNPIYEEVQNNDRIHSVYFHIDRIEAGVQVKFKAEKTDSWSGNVTTVESDTIECQ